MADFMQWVTHGIKRGRFDMDRRTTVYVIIFVILLTLSAALYLTLVSRTAARGRRIQQMEVQLSHLQREIEQLEVDIAKKSSVPYLWERAKDLDFAPAEQVEYIYVSED